MRIFYRLNVNNKSLNTAVLNIAEKDEDDGEDNTVADVLNAVRTANPRSLEKMDTAAMKVFLQDRQPVDNVQAVAWLRGRVTASAPLIITAGEPELEFSFGQPHSLSDTVQSVVDFYTEIGEALKNDGKVVNVVNTIREIAPIEEGDAGSERFPFVVIDAPSGSGKTQLPFALKAAELDTVHLVFQDNGQTIYRAFKNMSFDFVKAIDHDFEKIHTNYAAIKTEHLKPPLFKSKELSCDSLLRENDGSSQIVRFVFELLVDRSLCSRDSLPAKQTIANLRVFIRGLRESGKDVPVFVLDEAIAKDDEEKAKLRLARNILRAARIVVVLMGTNSCAYNLVTTIATGSREDVGAILPLWCHLITRLPLLNKDTLEIVRANEALAKLHAKGHEEFAVFLSEHILTCLPYFVVLLAQQIINCDDALFDGFHETADLMNFLFAKITLIVRNDKSHLLTFDGLRAQLALQCSVYQADNQTNNAGNDSVLLSLLYNNTDLFVACHFARLTLEDPKLYITAHGRLVPRNDLPDQSAWKRRACFASPRDDPLLYLIFLGQHRYLDNEGSQITLSPFRHKKDRDVIKMSTSKALLTVQSSNSGINAGAGTSAAGTVDSSSTNAIHRDGDALEALAAIALGCASRTNGFRGVDLLSFLKSLCAELMDLSSNGNSFSPGDVLSWEEGEAFAHGEGKQLNARFGTMHVPYTGPPNASWPESLGYIPSCSFASVTRPPNKAEVDLLALNLPRQPGGEPCNNCLCVSAESKNRKDPVDLKEFIGVLLRISEPFRDTLHILFSTQMQNDYFTEAGSWEAFCQTHTRFGSGNIAKLTLNGAVLNIERLTDKIAWQPWGICNALIVVIPIEELCSPKRPLNA